MLGPLSTMTAGLLVGVTAKLLDEALRHRIKSLRGVLGEDEAPLEAAMQRIPSWQQYLLLPTIFVAPWIAVPILKRNMQAIQASQAQPGDQGS